MQNVHLVTAPEFIQASWRLKGRLLYVLPAKGQGLRQFDIPHILDGGGDAG
jgi:hypothetical protein